MESGTERSDLDDKYGGEDSQSAKEDFKEGAWEKDSKDGLGVKVKRKSKRGRSSGSLTMKGDKITSFTTERGVIYHPFDHVYIENNKPNQPYFICAIQEFSVIKRDTLVVKVKWYYRVSEVPDNVYQHLVQDRYSQSEYVDSDHPIKDPAVKSRELFCSEATDTYPVTALRGKCKVVHCNSLEAARTFKPAADSFYCILGYNPETKRLATTQGQIRVGSMYQARMPECKPNVAPSDMPERCEDLEDFKWQPKSVVDGDLMMYLRAARSVAAFAGMCDGGSTEDGCQAASMDDTTINAMHVLHRYEYDTGKALQSLVKAPALRTIDKKWNEEDTKRFVKGLRVYGKNFFKIRKELLPYRETGELVEYYYYWKKTPAAAANRPHRRHRRHGVKRATTRSQRPASSEFLDSSGSDSDNDSEDSDGVNSDRCQNCFVTVSKDWNNAGKPSARLCTKCRIFFKKYGVNRPIDSTTGDSPYFQPVKDGDLNGAHNMLTRQNNNLADSKDKKKGSNSVSSLDSPSSDSKKSLIPSSPSAVSTCSNSSTDREKKKRRTSVSPGKDKKRHHQGSDSEEKFSKRKLTGPSDSESVSDSSISGAEETPNDADIETNQDELTSSSPPCTPSPVELDLKQDKSTPVPIPVESTIGDKLSQLPRPEPQHPSPNRQPLETPTLIPQLPGAPLPRQQIPGVPQIPSQGFVPLPPLPAFAFRPQGPLPDNLFPRSPFSEPLPAQKHSAEDTGPVPSATSVGPVQPAVSENKSETNVINSVKVKEEVITPPASPKQDFYKEESNSSNFMSGQCANSNGGFTQKEHFEIVTPKLEPGLPSANPLPQVLSLNSATTTTSSTSQRLGEPALTSQAEVKGHLPPQGQFESQGGQGEVKEVEEIEIEMEDEEYLRDGTLTPGPVPTPCNKEIHRSKTAIFIKVLNRGEHNSCSRCDLIFKPVVERKVVESVKKLPTPSTPAKEETKRKSDTPPPNSTADAQVISNIPPQHNPHPHQDRVTPRSYPDTPALRQLSEYAKPHTLGQDPRSLPGGYLGYPFMDPIRMSAMYPPSSRERLELELERDKRERDARERELREQELRSMEMRDKLKAELEMKPPGLDRLLPPGANPLDPHWLELQRRYGPPPVLPGSSAGGSPHIPGIYPPTSIASDLMARERERLERLGIPPGHPMLAEPSMYTAAIMERLSAERLSAERLSAERHHAERMALQDPLVRLQLAGMPGAAAAAAAAAAQHAHTHTHAHSHTHLHLHQQELLGHGPGPPPPIPTSNMHYPLLPPHLLPPDMLQSEQLTSRMIYQIYTQRMTHEQHIYMQRVSNELIMRAGSLPPAAAACGAGAMSKHERLPFEPSMSHLVYQFSRADPMSGVNGANNQTPPGSHPSLPVGMPPQLLPSREQELLQNDLYRRAYSDPALAQQLQAHHEALQRMAMERERFGSGHLPPPH